MSADLRPREPGPRRPQAELERNAVGAGLRRVRILLRGDRLELSKRRSGALGFAAQVRLGLLGREQPEEEEAQRRLVADRPRRLRLAQPAAHLVETGVGQLVDAAAARRRCALADQPGLAQLRELGVDLAVARGPGVGDRLGEVPDEPVARARAFREDTEQRMAESTCQC